MIFSLFSVILLFLTPSNVYPVPIDDAGTDTTVLGTIQYPNVYVTSGMAFVEDENEYALVTAFAQAVDEDGYIESLEWVGGGAFQYCSLASRTDKGLGKSYATSTAVFKCPVGRYWVFVTVKDDEGNTAQSEALLRVRVQSKK